MPSFQEIVQQLLDKYQEAHSEGIRLHGENEDLRRRLKGDKVASAKDGLDLPVWIRGQPQVWEDSSVDALPVSPHFAPVSLHLQPSSLDFVPPLTESQVTLDAHKGTFPAVPESGAATVSCINETAAEALRREGSMESLATQKSVPLNSIKKEPYKLHESWDEVSRQISDAAGRTQQFSFGRKRTRKSIYTDVSFKGRVVISPNARGRIAWDLAGMVLLLYDTIMIPLSPYQIPANDFVLAMDWVTLVFWTGDMFASTMTAYLDRGTLVTDLKLIRKHYMKTWFPLDCIVVVPDWIFTLLALSGGGGGNTLGRYGKLLRIFRILRCARLLRLAKLQNILRYIMDSVSSEYLFVCFQIGKMLVMLLFVNHFLAAAWYQIGAVSQGVGKPNWIDEYDLSQYTLAYRYVISLHWAITQFTPGSMSIQPQNLYERLFAIIVLMFGLVYFSSFISGITAAVTALRSLNDSSKQIWLMRKYLKQHNISQELMFRALRYCDHVVMQKNNNVAKSRVTMLDQLSQQLRLELDKEVTFSCVKVHPYLQRIVMVENPKVKILMQGMCGDAIQQMSYASGDIIFPIPGKEAEHMFIITSGTFKYENGEDRETIAVNDWMCEQALWTRWVHKGQAAAGEEGTLTLIDAVQFGKSMRKDTGLHKVAKEYGRLFLTWLNQDEEEIDDVFRSVEVKQKFFDFTNKSWETGGGKEAFPSKFGQSRSSSFSKFMNV